MDFEVVDASDPSPQPPDDDVISLGSRRARPVRTPRWIAGACVLLLVAAVAIAVATRSGGGAKHAALPAPSVTPAPRTGLTGLLGVPATTVEDIAIDGNSLYVLSADKLQKFDGFDGGAVSGSAPVAFSGASAHLVLDAASSRVWVTTASHIAEFDAAYLNPLRSIDVTYTISSAATLDGDLYLATGRGVYELKPGEAAPALVGSADAIFSITADPAHDRLLALRGGYPAELEQIRPNGEVAIAIGALPVSLASIAVVGDSVWVAGYGSGNRVIRLDAELLRPVAVSPVQSSVGAGAEVWPGAHDVWVHSGEGTDLWCIDASTGRILEHWSGVNGPVTAGGGGPYAIASSRVVSLVLSGACVG